ncbi:hypothetical protein CspHIS471_0402590 [Cutaneotrichosporon sp. HIS471]|nr:hypothetical protein CspHIS471_0402590 [Cutaneotrichosporon sp. HIS471]
MKLAIVALLLPALVAALPIAQDVEKRGPPSGNAGPVQVISPDTSAEQVVPAQNSGLVGLGHIGPISAADGFDLRREGDA